MAKPLHTLTDLEFDTLLDGLSDVIAVARALAEEPERIFEVNPIGSVKEAAVRGSASAAASTLLSVITSLNSVAEAVVARRTEAVNRMTTKVHEESEKSLIQTPQGAGALSLSLLLGGVIGANVEIDRGNIQNAQRILVSARKAAAPLFPIAFDTRTRAGFAKAMREAVDTLDASNAPPEMGRAYERFADEAFEGVHEEPAEPDGPAAPQITNEEIDRLYAAHDDSS